MAEFNSLTTLIKRLEAATTRLEDLAHTGTAAQAISQNINGNVRNSTIIPTAPAPTASMAPEPGTSDTIPPVMAAYNEVIEGSLKKYLELSKQIGDLVATQSIHVNELFLAQRDLIFIATQSTKPAISSPVLADLIKPTQQAIEKVTEIKEKNRGSPFQNHLSAVSEGVPALSWITIEPKPSQFVDEMKNSAQYYANRVMNEFKEKDRVHVEWAQAFIKTLTELQAYVKKHHTTGLGWNPKGSDPATFIGKGFTTMDASTLAASAVAESSSSSGVPPPPPPPPVLTEFSDMEEKSKGGINDVFAELNKGEAITAGLRKVDKSQMTHKNPSLRASGSVEATSPNASKKPGPPTPDKPKKYTLKKPAKTSLEGTKYTIENHENNNSIVIEGSINNTVYIFSCKNSTIQIKGKVNAVSMDSCTKCGLAIDSTVSAVDIVNSKSFALQIFQKTPVINVDKCDGGLIYLSKESLSVELFTAKCSALNVLVPDANGEDGEFKEIPIPEQFKSTITEGKISTVAVEYLG